MFEAKVEGKMIFDPRDCQMKISDNPALIFADLVIKQPMLVSRYANEGNNVEFWDFIREMATWCEEQDYIKEVSDV
ncbi:hypothetical protein [Shewanella sp.]|jgi:hypothetical protein|uniref:hypothetical protein n=1 Tax=Shewanella sp. TaxID=50422 RepID=UPI003563FD41